MPIIEGMGSKVTVCRVCGQAWSDDDLCVACFADLNPGVCRGCGVIFRNGTPRSEQDVHLCRPCHREQVEQERVQAAAEPDWAQIEQLIEALPEAHADTDLELQRAQGEGPGVLDDPPLLFHLCDKDAPEKLARLRLYERDVSATRPITFIGRETAMHDRHPGRSPAAGRGAAGRPGQRSALLRGPEQRVSRRSARKTAPEPGRAL